MPSAGLISGLVLAEVFTFNRNMPDAPSLAVTDGRSLDDLLVAVARDRDRAAFGLLFGQIAPRLKAYLVRSGVAASQADELVQEVMLMVWRRADSFDPARSAASTWIFTIARNKRIDAIRRDRRPGVRSRATRHWFRTRLPPPTGRSRRRRNPRACGMPF